MGRLHRARRLAAAAVAVPLAVLLAQGSPAEEPLGGSSAGVVQGLQGTLLADPASREQVLSMQDDPLVQQILRDPESMRALESGDLGRLLADPKIRALAEHPTVKGLAEQQAR